MKRILLTAVVLVVIGIPALATAVVQPPEEWFDSPEKYAQWEQMWPVLNDWEFGEQQPLLGTHAERLANIQAHLGMNNLQVAEELAVPVDSPELMKIDLNLDGRISSRDVLELGYQTQPATKGTSIAPPTGTNEWVVLRGDFQDYDADYETYDVQYFEDRFFSENTAAKPSANDYFSEVSYGALQIDGIVGQDTGGPGDGWYKGEHTKSWYISNSGAWLVYEAVLAMDDEIDYSQYDVDGDGYVDTVLLYYPDVVFSGGLWPHRSSGLNIHVDGVIIDSYFISGYNRNNDSHTMVIAVHEYGHILGWPDLYDIDYSGNGCGRWSLMAYNYDNSQRPPSPDPWCKTQLGWVDPIVITENVAGYALGCFQDDPFVLKIWTDGQEGDQYFLVANYRKKKTDTPRPGEGLLVLHIDDSIGGGNQDNRNEQRKHVDVESARGYVDPSATNVYDPLDMNSNPPGGDNGNANDLWFIGNSDPDYTGVFDDDSNPFANAYPHPGPDTHVKLSNISAAGDTMTLDIEVESPGRPTCTITAPTGGTISGETAIDVDATASDGRTISYVDFYCNGAYLGRDTESPFSLSFDSAAIYEGERQIRVLAMDNQGSSDTDTVSVTVENDTVGMPYLHGFENGIHNWAAYDEGGNRRWEQKDEAFEGDYSAGIGATSGGYDYNEHDSLVSCRIALPLSSRPIARFKQRYRVASGENNAKVYVTADEGRTFDLLASFTGSNLAWHPAAVDLSDYVGQQIRLVFRLEGSSLNRSSGEAGYWVDDVIVKELSAPPMITGITPGDGSMLSGMATISVSATDDEGVDEVRLFIDNTDQIATLHEEPFEFEWNSDWVFDGEHTLTAQAFDGDYQSDAETVSWTTGNAGIVIPWGDSFEQEPTPGWRIVDEAGAGMWHRLETGGYDGGPFMRFAIPGENNHDNNDFDLLISPTLDLAGVSSPNLYFLHRYDIERNYDYGHVFVTTDLENWDELAVYSQTNQGWAPVTLSLDAYVNQKIKLAWFFESDGGLVEGGWWVDAVQAAPPPVITGTSPAKVLNGQEVVIQGTGFGAPEALEFHGVLIGALEPTVLDWSADAITIVVPDGISSSTLKVTAYGRESNEFTLVVVIPPPDLTGTGQL